MQSRLTSRQRSTLDRVLDQGRKLQGIKLVREYLDLSQDEAKKFVEQFILEKTDCCHRRRSN